MTTFCHALPQSIGQEMLQVAAKAICDHPGDSPFLRDSRTRQMVFSVMGFGPRDGMEYMHATIIVGHYQMILNAMHQVLQGQMDSMKARTRSGIVSLDRGMLAFGRDMRELQGRPLARRAQEAPRQAEVGSAPDPVDVAAWVADWSGMPPAAPVPETMAPGAARGEPAVTAGARSVQTAAAVPSRTTAITPASVAIARAESGQAPVRRTEPARDQRAPATVPPAEASRPATRPMDPTPRPIAPGPATVNQPAVASGSGQPPPNEVDEETMRHIADFEAALAALTETLEEARALDGGKTEATAANGD